MIIFAGRVAISPVVDILPIFFPLVGFCRRVDHVDRYATRIFNRIGPAIYAYVYTITLLYQGFEDDKGERGCRRQSQTLCSNVQQV